MKKLSSSYSQIPKEVVNEPGTKLSELYRAVALCILRDAELRDDMKLVILREIMDRERTEKFCEEQAAKKALAEKEAAV